MSHADEPSLTTHGVKVIGYFC